MELIYFVFIFNAFGPPLLIGLCGPHQKSTMEPEVPQPSQAGSQSVRKLKSKKVNLKLNR